MLHRGPTVMEGTQDWIQMGTRTGPQKLEGVEDTKRKGLRNGAEGTEEQGKEGPVRGHPSSLHPEDASNESGERLELCIPMSSIRPDH